MDFLFSNIIKLNSQVKKTEMLSTKNMIQSVNMNKNKKVKLRKKK